MPPAKPPSSPRDAGVGPSGIEDFLDGEVLDPDAPASAAERAHATSFAELIDKAMAGRTPPALASDERALLEVSAVVRAAAGHAELGAPQRRAVVEEALVQALGARDHGPRVSMAMAAPRSRAARWLPWGLAAAASMVAVAAVALLWLRAPQQVVVSGAAAVPPQWRSRPADPLVGEIQREAAADAAARIDSIYSDRMDGYRDATLLRRGGAR
jgi:hypothetical protein